MGKRVSRNTFDPRLATRSAIYRFTPEIRAITTISVETERIIPRSIRKERSLWARIVSSATLTGSRNNTRRFIRSHQPVLFYDYLLGGGVNVRPMRHMKAAKFAVHGRTSHVLEFKWPGESYA